ncbi:hypothetical protein TorRG33x02_267100, partial [Trema orientale]
KKSAKKMVVTSSDEAAPAATFKAEYDRATELKAFDETKAGVKGLVDAGIFEIPRIFYNSIPESYIKNSSVVGDAKLLFPLLGIHCSERRLLTGYEKHPRTGASSKLSTMESQRVFWER